MSLFSDVFGSNDNVIEDNNQQIAIHDDDLAANGINNNINRNNEMKVDEEQSKQPLYKIVQHITMYGMKEYDFYSLKTAVAHWESLTYLLASIWYQWDHIRKTWNIKDSYGTANATQKIIDYMNNKYHSKNTHKTSSIRRQNSIISYITSFVSNDTEITTNDAEDEKTAAQNIEFLNDFFKFTEIYTQKSGIKPITHLNVDNAECNDLIVSLVWSVGFQCYFLKSYAVAQQTWKSLGVWYTSVWFTRNSQKTFVVHDNFGTSDSIRRICRFVNDAQETWNYVKYKNKMINFRPLNEDEDNIMIGKKSEDENKETKETTKGDDEDDSKLCIVCLDGDRDHIIIPCGHICICKTCKDLYSRDEATCPMCRSKVEKVIKTFN